MWKGTSLLCLLMCGCGARYSATTVGVSNYIVHAQAGQTVKQAVDSLPPAGGVVVLGIGVWNSGYQAGGFISKPNITIQGSGMPGYMSDFSAMFGGTIVLGPLVASSGADFLKIVDLGVDAGPAYIDANNGGVATDALAIVNIGQLIGAPPVQSLQIENVSCLGSSPLAPVHCMLVENVNNAYVHNVQTVMNCHGLVLKGRNSRVDGVYARGHGIDSVIVKSDAYAPASQDTLSNIRIEPLVSPGDTKGIIVIGVGAPVTDIAISNVTVQSPLSWAIYAQGASAATSASRLSFSNVTVNYQNGSPSNEYCVQLVQYVSGVGIDNLNCSNMWAGIAPYLPVSGVFRYFTVTNSHFTNIASNAIETYDSWELSDNTFVSVGNGIVNPFGVTMIGGNTFSAVSGGEMLSVGGIFVALDHGWR